MTTEKKLRNFILRFLPFALCLCLICIFLFSDTKITAESIVSYAPKNPLLAAVFLLFLYALKSLTVFMPITILHIAGGFLFSTPLALIINITGTSITFVLPYLVGNFSGADAMDRVHRKIPKIEKIVSRISNDNFFLSFILRAVSCLPGDAVSMFLGAKRVPFSSYFLGSLLGALPGILTETLIGFSITDPSSPMFWISVGLTVLTNVGSVTGYVIWEHRKRKNET
jgi:uncharacterized membrane protein YdjX (TVP38/TMEM64 family)